MWIEGGEGAGGEKRKAWQEELFRGSRVNSNVGIGRQSANGPLYHRKLFAVKSPRNVTRVCTTEKAFDSK